MASDNRSWPRRWAAPVKTPPMCWMTSSARLACHAACARYAWAESTLTRSQSRQCRHRGCRATRAPSKDHRSCAKFWTWPHKRIRTTMYTGKQAKLRPLQPAFIMAGTGEAVTYGELEARSNRLAHLFRKRGLKRLDHYAIFMENNSRYLEACGAGERSGLYSPA